MAAANTGNGAIEWDKLPTDGSMAWFGLLLLAGSSVASLAALRWVIAAAIEVTMQ